MGESLSGRRNLEDGDVWLTAWCAVASCWNTKDLDCPARWADRALKQYRERFPKQSDPTEGSPT